jgi:protein gp37
MGDTSIEWTQNPDGTPGKTWNPTRGCSRVSEGCRNCYAEVIAARFSDPGSPFHLFADRKKSGSKWTGKVELIESMLADPLHWRKPQRIFVNSMSDLFHEELSDEAIGCVFCVMALCPQHTFQILTKRPERMAKWFSAERPKILDDLFLSDKVPFGYNHGHIAFCQRDGLCNWPLENIWLGTSVEDQKTADERIPHLLKTPAAIRFVSYEPALGPVDFAGIAVSDGTKRNVLTGEFYGVEFTSTDGRQAGTMTVKTGIRLDQVIIGGESGPRARPFDIDWARNTIKQCRAAGVAPFVKQLGAKPINTDYTHLGHQMRIGDGNSEYNKYIRVALKDRKGGNMEEWAADLRVREWPKADRP